MMFHFLFSMAMLWSISNEPIVPDTFAGKVTDTDQTSHLMKEIMGKTEHHIRLLHDTITLQEVIIKDKRRESQRKEETVSVEVVGADFIRAYQSGSLMQTLSRLPGIQAVNVGSGQSKPLIRGLGFNRIVVTENGIKHEGQQWGADHALEVDQFVHDQIELVKGPSSLAYGSDAIGGVVILSQRKVPEPQSLSAMIDLLGRSSNRLLGTSAALEGRRKKWYFTSRITWLDYADARVPTDSVDVYSFRVPLTKNRLRNTAGDELNLHLSMGYVGKDVSSRLYVSRVEQQAGFFANAHGLEPRRVNTELYDRYDRDISYPRQQASHFKVSNHTAINLGNMLFISEMGYQHNVRDEFSQYVNHGYRPPAFPDTLPMSSDLERSFNKYTFSANMRIIGQISDRQQMTAGLFAQHQNNSIGGISFLMPAFRQNMLGGYLLHDLKATPALNIKTGIRYDNAYLRTDAYYDWFQTHGSFLQRADALKRKFNSFSGIIGVNYHTNKAIVRANLGRSFRIPLAKELAANGVNYHHFSYEVGDSSLEPEIAWQIDLGAEYTSARFHAGLSPFISYFPNYIYLNPSYLFDFDHGAGNQVFHYTASEVIRWGVELSLFGQLHEKFTAELNAEYTYSEQLSGDKQGFTIPFSPPASALASFSWQPWQAASNEKLRHLSIVTDVRITVAQNRIVPPEKKTPGYQTINMGISGKLPWNQTALNWNVMVNNLFNTHYMEHTSYYRLVGVPEPGRNITLSINLPIMVESRRSKVKDKSI